MAVLPGRSWGDDDFLDPYVLHAVTEVPAVDAVAIPEQEPRRCFERERLDELLSRPPGCRVARDVEVDDATTIMPVGAAVPGSQRPVLPYRP